MSMPNSNSTTMVNRQRARLRFSHWSAVAILSVVAATLRAATWDTVPNFSTNWYDGASSSYTINSAQRLAGMAVLVNNNVTNFTGVTLTLTADINLSAHEWSAIGNSSLPFCGTFDGLRHVISKLMIDNASLSYQGLFGYVGAGAMIRNLCLTDTQIHAKDRVGGIAGYLGGGTIDGCDNKGVIYAASSYSYAGGIVGYAGQNSQIRNCSNHASVEGQNYVAGILGYMLGNGDIRNNLNRGQVTGTYAGAVGGIVGRLACVLSSPVELANCLNLGVVEGSTASGGLIGNLHTAVIASDSYWIRPDAWQGTWNAAGSGAQPTNSFYFSVAPGWLNAAHPLYATSNLLVALNAHVAAQAVAHPQLRTWSLIGSQDGYPMLAPRVPVTFDANGGTGTQTNILALYGSEMPEIAIAVKQAGYLFTGYFDAEKSGTRYYNADGTSAAAWERSTATTLYAQWEPATYTLSFDPSGGTGAQNKVLATYLEWLPAIVVAVTRIGYNFDGYFDAASGGSRYYDYDGSGVNWWDKTTDTTLYAQWLPKMSDIVFDPNGGSGWQSTTYATYGEPMSTLFSIDIYRSGYTFTGFFDAASGGTRYYNADGSSARTWNKEEQWVELYAQWAPAPYTISFHANGGTGTQTNITAYFNSPLPQLAIAVSRAGHTFQGYADDNDMLYYNANGTSVRDWEVPENSVLYAAWRPYNWSDPGAYATNWYAESALSFTISNAQQLAGFAVLVNQGVDFSAATVSVIAEISLAGREWSPIGDASSFFVGTFDGGYHTISNLVINAPNSYGLGLFGTVADGLIQRVRLAGTVIQGGSAVGAIAGILQKGTLRSCSNHGSIQGVNEVGGISGFVDSDAELLNCSNQGSVAGVNQVGGIAGWMQSTSRIVNAANHASVQGSDYVGGLVGHLHSARVYNSVNRGAITATTAVGGLVGDMSSIGAIYNGLNLGSVSNISGLDIGGIAGASQGTAQNSYWRHPDSQGNLWNATPAGVTLLECEPFSTPPGKLANPAYGTNDLLAALNACTATIKPTLPAVWGWSLFGSEDGYPILAAESLISFDSNGGSGEQPAVAALYRVDLPALPTINISRTGYLFTGFDDAPAGGVTYYNASGEGTRTWDKQDNTTLYAGWTPITYTVTYHGNGHTAGATADSLHTYDTPLTLTGNGFSRIGYNFSGWAVSPGGTIAYLDDQQVANLANTQDAVVDLYVVWTPETYTVSFDANNGSGAQVPVIATYDAAMPPLQIGVHRPGWRFDGYFDAADGGTRYYTANGTSAALWKKEEDTLLFARWTRILWSEAGQYDIGWYAPELSSFSLNQPEQLAGLAVLVNAGNTFAGKQIALAAAINLYPFAWIPIGTPAKPFRGTFDGRGHAITGLAVEQPAANDQGFFGYAGTDTLIQNVNLVDVQVQGNTNVGALAGQLSSGIARNCQVSGMVSGAEHAGGLIGLLNGTLRNTLSTATVTAATRVGGLTGTISGGTAQNSYWLRDPGETGLDWDGAGAGTLSECFHFLLPPGALNGEPFQSSDLTGALNAWVAANSTATPELLTWSTYDSPTGYPRLTPRVTITFDLSGGSGNQPPILAVYGAELPAIAVSAARSGHTFQGYYGAPEGGSRYYNSDGTPTKIWNQLSDATLYAGWSVMNWCDPGRYDTAWHDLNPLASSFMISASEELAGFAVLVNSGITFAGKVLFLTGSLDLTGPEWTAIGSNARPFLGTFDGNGKTITGIKINQPTKDYQGLFGMVGAGGMVRSVRLIQTEICGGAYVGGVAGWLAGTTRNCANAGVVNGGEMVGGLAGLVLGTLVNCANHAAVAGLAYVGGVAGYVNGNVRNVINIGAVTGANTVGGVAGEADGAVRYAYWKKTGDEGFLWDASGLGGTLDCSYFTTPPGTLSASVHNTTALNAALNAWTIGQGAYSAWTTAGSSTGYPMLSIFNSMSFTITFDANNGNGTQAPIMATYNEPMPDLSVAVSRPGQKFTGYFTAPVNGIQYVDATGSGTREWNQVQDVTLYAHWADDWSGEGYYDTSWHDNDPKRSIYYIGNSAELAGLSVLVAHGNPFTGKMILLTNHLDLAGMDWIPIGSESARFQGFFDGNWYTISGLTIDHPVGDDQGLFGFVGAAAIIQNLNLINTAVRGQAYVGGIAGWLEGMLRNCANAGTIAGDYHCGGIAGVVIGTVRNCGNSASITGGAYAGGIAGYSIGILQNCLSIGAVAGVISAGGIVGETEATGVTTCYWRQNAQPEYSLPAVGLGPMARCFYFDAAPGTLNTLHPVYETTFLLTALNDYTSEDPALSSWTLQGSATGYPILGSLRAIPTNIVESPQVMALTVTAQHIIVVAGDIQEGATYVLLKSLSLEQPDWQPIATLVAQPGQTTITFMPERSANQPRAFFRVQAQQVLY